ncbi:MarR family transcriptional regulator [Bordetella genomosp. 10]|uniref:MarR family transcriptional regulator n=1 Tax=Bordetella genomosp. 10 TaxID=1416804 RepID=A0A261SCI7_9BORD|nr:MarR family winged helix-turn-helix transcriptional regulator [Bordetella genomosp. 10]OZI35056.1 MarR family transcriptional regulator [Bordetella genomosp. 10]
MNTPADTRLMALTAHLMVIHRAYRAAADKALADYGLSQATAWPVITAGRLGDGVRQGVLAEAMGVEGPSLVRVLDQLVAAGLIERREDPLDRRAKTVHLTEAGNELRERVETMLVHLRRRLFAGCDENDLEACMRVFESLKSSLAHHHSEPGTVYEPLPHAPAPGGSSTEQQP